MVLPLTGEEQPIAVPDDALLSALVALQAHVRGYRQLHAVPALHISSLLLEGTTPAWKKLSPWQREVALLDVVLRRVQTALSEDAAARRAGAHRQAAARRAQKRRAELTAGYITEALQGVPLWEEVRASPACAEDEALDKRLDELERALPFTAAYELLRLHQALRVLNTRLEASGVSLVIPHPWAGRQQTPQQALSVRWWAEPSGQWVRADVMGESLALVASPLRAGDKPARWQSSLTTWQDDPAGLEQTVVWIWVRLALVPKEAAAALRAWSRRRRTKG